MATIKEVLDGFPNRINDILKNQMMEKLDPELKRQLIEKNGNILFDYEKGTYTVVSGDDALDQAIISDLRSKKNVSK